MLADYAPVVVTEIVPARRGEFEVELDGELLISRLKADRFPEYDELRPERERRLGPPPQWR